jgi:hypothetical protein
VPARAAFPSHPTQLQHSAAAPAVIVRRSRPERISMVAAKSCARVTSLPEGIQYKLVVQDRPKDVELFERRIAKKKHFVCRTTSHRPAVRFRNDPRLRDRGQNIPAPTAQCSLPQCSVRDAKPLMCRGSAVLLDFASASTTARFGLVPHRVS